MTDYRNQILNILSTLIFLAHAAPSAAAIDCSGLTITSPQGVLAPDKQAEYEARIRGIEDYEKLIHNTSNFRTEDAVGGVKQLDTILEDASLPNVLKSRVWIAKSRLQYRIGDQNPITYAGAGKSSVTSLHYAVCTDPTSLSAAAEYAQDMDSFADHTQGYLLLAGLDLGVSLDKLRCEAGRNYGSFPTADTRLVQRLVKFCVQ